jgi:TusA-related sulfurtransferase
MKEFVQESDKESAQSIESLDLRGTPCPLNFVRSKLKLQRMSEGSQLEILLDAGEPIEQVPDSLKVEGYLIAALEAQDDFFVVRVQCPTGKS